MKFDVYFSLLILPATLILLYKVKSESYSKLHLKRDFGLSTALNYKIFSPFWVVQRVR